VTEETKLEPKHVALIEVTDCDAPKLNFQPYLKPKGWEAYKSAFAEGFVKSAYKDFEAMHEYESQVNAKLEEIHALMEQIYVIRHHTSMDKHEVLEQVKEMVGEVNKLNEELSQLRDNHMRRFSDSLDLADLGIVRRIHTRSFRKPSKVQFEELNNPLLDSTGSESTELPMKRTQSTKTFADKTANDKWLGLFHMFREYRFARQMEESKQILLVPNEEINPTHINKLRAAIYTLLQRKPIDAASSELLLQLQAKLRAVTHG